MENWKRYLNESEVQEEGWKDIALAGALGLSSLAGPAQAADVDVPPEVATQTVESLSAQDMESIDDFFLRIVNPILFISLQAKRSHAGR